MTRLPSVFAALFTFACTSEPATQSPPSDAGAPIEDASWTKDAGVEDAARPADAGPGDAGVGDTAVDGGLDTGVDAGMPVDAGPGQDAGPPMDAGGQEDVGSPVDAGPAACPPPANPTRAESWIRSNAMFISGLVPGMGIPTAAHVSDYFDLFHATAAHFWQDGLPVNADGWAAANHPSYRFVSWTNDDGSMLGNSAVLGGYPADAPGRIGFQIGDEPVTMAELSALFSGAANVRAADPNALIILNFTVSRAEDIDAQLAASGADPNVDVFSYDLYTYTKDAYGALELIREAAKTHGKSYWRYLASYHDAGDTSRPSASDMRWDAFVGLLYGYTGHSWFVYQVGPPHTNPLNSDLFDAPASYDANKTAEYQIAAELNEQMAILGRSIALLESTDVRYVAANALLQPDGTTAWSPGAGGDPYMTSISAAGNFHEFSVGYFEDDCSDVYVMVQNALHTNGNFPTVLDQPEQIRIDFDLSGATDPSFDPTVLEVLDHTTGGTDLLPLTDLGNGAAYVEISIDPGDVFFFKYRTGRPFALQP